MRAFRPLTIVVALMTLGAADARTARVPSEQRESKDGVAVGVIRRDGLVIPIGTFDGRRWASRWPAPQLDLEVPISLTSVPKGWWGPAGPIAEWQVWPSTGEPRTVRVTQPDWVEAHCLRQVGLRTDYRSDQPIPPLREQPYPKDGLAVSPPQAIGRIEKLTAASLEPAELHGLMREAFDRAERELASRYSHPIKESTREAIRPDIEAMYAFGTAPRVYYVEAARGYTTLGRHDECAIAFGTGWFTRDGDNRLRKLDMAVDLLRCDRYGASYMLPLGVVRAAERTFWIVQYAGWDHERFVVAEIKKDKVEAAVVRSGGGC
jgi:hypothetical protein